MKKSNPKKYFYISLIIFLLIGLLLSFSLTDTFIDLFIQNSLLWYFINQLKPFIILIVLAIIFFVAMRNLVKKQEILSSLMEETRINQVQVMQYIRNEFLFFKHLPDKPFDQLSIGVKDILGYNRDDFRLNYIKYGYSFLFEGIFDKIKQNIENYINTPPIENEVFTQNGDKKYIEVKFTPIFDNNNVIVSIEGAIRDITEKKNLENILNDKELVYRTLFEANNESVAIIKGDKFIDCNKKLCDLFEASIEEVIMHTPYSFRFTPPLQPDGRNSRDKAIEKIRIALTGNNQNFDWQHLKSNGQPFLVNVSLYRFSYNEELYLYAILRDVEMEHKILNELSINKNSLYEIISNSPMGVLQFNESGKITNINNNFYSITKLPENSLLDNDIYSIEMPDGLIENFNLCLKGQKLHYCSYTEQFGNRKDIYLNMFLIPLYNEYNASNGGIVLIEETTEKEQLRQFTQKCKQGLDEIISNSREILYKLCLKSGTYEYISPSLNEILGYKPEEFYKMSSEQIADLLHPDDRENSNIIVAKMIQPVLGENVGTVIQYRIRHKLGQYIAVSDKYSIKFDTSGAPLYIYGNVLVIQN